jgi:diaminohydroxyphosphoribosylaminopyrimidine deaminase/5-amino-6-(5-phosphoribosylamino)uracil reductase
MALALALGRRMQGQVWPNPAVGCVIVAHGRIVGRGSTAAGGRPHAETQALKQAGDLARGATVYVTLEPCAHHGQTPPCAQALIDAGVARVVTALADPDPRVNGGGHAMLEAAGINTQVGLLADRARRDHAGFLAKILARRPFLTLKLANSFDGRIALENGESQWITGPSARWMVHAMRARHDAVLVGAGTARLDDPSLTVRDLGITRQPVRVVVSNRLDIPDDGVLARSARTVPLWLCHGVQASQSRREHWHARGARCLLVDDDGAGQLDPVDIMAKLAQEGLTRVFCEGGGTLAASLLRADLVDDLVGFMAGLVIGSEGKPSMGAMGLTGLAQAHRFVLSSTRPVGADVLTRWERHR